MRTKKQLEQFDPKQWADSSAESKQRSDSKPGAEIILLTDLEADIRHVVRWLVEHRIDITQGYENWLRLGFALSDGLGEAGRDLFHQLSRLNEEYNPTECDKQYTACLHGKGQGVSVRTFFHMAGEAGFDLRALALEKIVKELPLEMSPDGVDEAFFADFANSQLYPEMYEMVNPLNINDDYNFISPDAPVQNAETAKNSYERRSEQQPLATFTDQIPLEDWCHLMREVMEPMRTPEAKDKMVLGSLVVISGVTPNYYTIYRGKIVYPPLYVIIYGPTASGKGEIVFCVLLIRGVQQKIESDWVKEMEEYRRLHAEWEQKGQKRGADRSQRGPEPQEPPFRTPIIPANSSASAAYQLLHANGDWGVMFETEGSVMMDTIKSDYGDYVPGLLQAFHHESIKMNRVRDKQHIQIDQPRLPICMSGTEDMMRKLFQYQEQGLCNRFFYYGLSSKMEWDSPFQEVQPLERHYEKLGQVVLDIYHQMKQLGNRSIQFMLTESQKREFNQFFSDLLADQRILSGEEFSSFVLRMGLNAVRIAMTLALLRRYDECKGERLLFLDNEQALICSDTDFRIMMTMVNVLVNHSMKAFATFGKCSYRSSHPQVARMNAQERLLFEALDEEFTSGQVEEKAQELGMNVSTVQRYLSNYIKKYEVAVRVKNGLFRKVNVPQ